MLMSAPQMLITIGMVTLGTIITRFLPFVIFPPSRKTPGYITFLGRVLPYSVIGLLVVYCLKDVRLTSSPFGIPEAIAIVCIVSLEYWKSNVLLSIGIGTVVYMLLVQLVFI